MKVKIETARIGRDGRGKRQTEEPPKIFTHMTLASVSIHRVSKNQRPPF